MYNAETGIKLRIIDNVDVMVIILILLEYVNVSLLVNRFFYYTVDRAVAAALPGGLWADGD